jgi:hypothetical protein
MNIFSLKELYLRYQIIIISIYLITPLSVFAEADDEYIINFIALNKNYRDSLSAEIPEKSNYVIFTSYLPSTVKEKNGEHIEILNYGGRIKKFKILKKIKLSPKNSSAVLTQLKDNLKGETVTISMGDLSTHKISVYNKHDVLLFETQLNCFNLINIKYPLSSYVDRVNSNLFFEAAKYLPLSEEQYNYLAAKLPKEYFNEMKKNLHKKE